MRFILHFTFIYFDVLLIRYNSIQGTVGFSSLLILIDSLLIQYDSFRFLYDLIQCWAHMRWDVIQYTLFTTEPLQFYPVLLSFNPLWFTTNPILFGSASIRFDSLWFTTTNVASQFSTDMIQYASFASYPIWFSSGLRSFDSLWFTTDPLRFDSAPLRFDTLWFTTHPMWFGSALIWFSRLDSLLILYDSIHHEDFFFSHKVSETSFQVKTL